MNVLYVQRFDLWNVACARRAVCLCRELAALGHRVTLVNFPHAERRRQFAGGPPDLPAGVTLLDLDRRGSALFRNTRILTEKAAGADVVHLWKSYSDISLPSIRAALKAKKPLHYDWDDWEIEITRELTGSNLAAHLTGVMERQVLRFADSITTASEELRKTAILGGFPEERIRDLPVGADLNLFHPENREKERTIRQEKETGPVLIYVGQMEVAHYADQALEVLSRMTSKNATLTMLGGGPGLAALREKAAQMEIAPRVRFTDYVPAEDIPRFLARADLMLAPFADTKVTRCKSPLKIAEALASGLPVIASDVGEARNMVEGCGRLCPPGDTEAMARAADDLLSDSSAWERAGVSARKRAEERYNWPALARELEGAYRSAIEAQGTGKRR